MHPGKENASPNRSFVHWGLTFYLWERQRLLPDLTHPRQWQKRCLRSPEAPPAAGINSLFLASLSPLWNIDVSKPPSPPPGPRPPDGSVLWTVRAPVLTACLCLLVSVCWACRAHTPGGPQPLQGKTLCINVPSVTLWKDSSGTVRALLSSPSRGEHTQSEVWRCHQASCSPFPLPWLHTASGVTYQA